MAVQNVANNPLGSYPVLVDKNTANSEMQVIRLDFGTGTAESRVTAANPLPVSGTFSGTISATTNEPVETVTTEANSTLTGVSSSILAANANRVGGWVKNIGNANVYISFSATATTGKPTILGPGASLTLSGSGWVYTGEVAGITGGGSVSIEVVEL